MKVELDETSAWVTIVLGVIVMITVVSTVAIIRCTGNTRVALEKGYVETQCKGASGTMWTKP